MPHVYTKEQDNFIRQNVKGIGNKELTDRFNKHFNLDLGVNQIKAYKKNHKLSSGLDGRFVKGQESWNKGLKGLNIGGKETQYKKGHMPHNYVPVGSERINADGYMEVKIKDPKKWRAKHLLVWEEHNGPVPKGHAVIFGDRNRENFDINNLILISKKQLLMLNRHKLIQRDADLTKTGIIIADLYQKINERKG